VANRCPKCKKKNPKFIQCFARENGIIRFGFQCKKCGHKFETTSYEREL